MPEQAALVKARDSVHAARLLRSDNLYDFAISRAYYTMFYIAQAFLESDSAIFHPKCDNAFPTLLIREHRPIEKVAACVCTSLNNMLTINALRYNIPCKRC